ncbi:GNAT family N-acetyltransferase [Alkalibacillus almallahensis]|uniref:GNAT family N-acetyltransferase n=1 Tax=Alkalibacillus almallahensis TaxID=1379154 RepID=UPI001FBB3C04|nr:GNAT family N-acetyltransferase [Alkalibacillus almallahensis]NIK11506.1 GNAT superfamily N-acetyltransferase [Alkalibacillus almallahensis]
MIRPAQQTDLSAITKLMGELGYPTNEQDMAHRLNKINSNPMYNTQVAERHGMVVGMIGMILGYHYEKNDDYVRIVALVVDSHYRKQGIGQELIQEAEKWAKQQGAGRLVLNSGNRGERADAHQFYTNLGFEGKATGFYKLLSS